MTNDSLNRRSFLIGAGCFAVAATRPSAFAASASDVAHDPLRPAYHLMPPHNWMNDPNGPIWWQGKYHLFYQLNPNAAVWGDMHWGHAVSTDMIHWHHESPALAPTPGGPDADGCFSGSAVLFDGVPTFIYTGVQKVPPDQITIHDGSSQLRETQLLATAEDAALTRWKKQPQPIIPAPPADIDITGFRDPFLWQETDGWYLGVGSGQRGKGGCVLLYYSRDLHHWDYLHPFIWGTANGKQSPNPCDTGEMWECPDFFSVVGGHCLNYSTEDKTFWSTGDYDRHAHTFTAKQKGVLDQGHSWYAPKSFEAPDKRRILWGWLRETRPEAEFAAAGWSGCMSLPRVLSIDSNGKLQMRPAKEVESLRGSAQHLTASSSRPLKIALPNLQQELLIPLSAPTDLTIRLHSAGTEAWKLVMNASDKTVHCGDLTFLLPDSPWPYPFLHLFLDGSVVEVFLGGHEALTSRIYTLREKESEIEVETPSTHSLSASLWSLKPISADRLTT